MKIFRSIKTISRKTWPQQDAQVLLDSPNRCIICEIKKYAGRNAKTEETVEIALSPLLKVNMPSHISSCTLR
jgi:hypothetical protein